MKLMEAGILVVDDNREMCSLVQNICRIYAGRKALTGWKQPFPAVRQRAWLAAEAWI